MSPFYSSMPFTFGVLMAKLLANIVLITVLLFSQWYNSIVTIVYEINQDYYIEVLCENKSKPELHCDGQCYFAKQLALYQSTNKEAEPPELLPTLRLFNVDDIGNSLNPMDQLAITPKTYFVDIDLQSPFIKVDDHPPQV